MDQLRGSGADVVRIHSARPLGRGGQSSKSRSRSEGRIEMTSRPASFDWTSAGNEALVGITTAGATQLDSRLHGFSSPLLVAGFRQYRRRIGWPLSLKENVNGNPQQQQQNVPYR